MPQERSRLMASAKRVRTFEEVRLGLSRSDALENARILLDREKSVKGEACPLGTDIFGVLRLVAKGHLSQALTLLLETNPLPSVTGRLCDEAYAETQVFNRKAECVSWRAIERYLGDHVRPLKLAEVRQRQKVAVIGSGPAGLAAAYLLKKLGFRVTIFEASHVPGGSLSYAYPGFRLPSRVLVRLLAGLKELGIGVETNVLFGRSLLPSELSDNGFAAVLLACGAGLSVPLSVPGADAAGIFSVEDVLRLRHWMNAGVENYRTPMEVGRNILLLGSGERMIDAARLFVRLGRSSTVLVNGSETHVGVDAATLREAVEEGVKINTFVRPKTVIKDHVGCIRSLLCERLDYKVDTLGRLNVVVEPDGEFSLEADTLVTCFGVQPDTLFLRDIAGLKLDSDGAVWLKPGTSAETSLNGVFACGHLVFPVSGLAEAVNSAKRATGEIDKFLSV